MRTKRICRTKSRRTSPKPSGTSPPKVDRQPANRPQLESCHAMTQLGATHSEKLLYTARVRATGGREHGVARSSDGQLDVRLSTPGDAGSGTNPEQLLAAGWSACFESALDLGRAGAIDAAAARGRHRGGPCLARRHGFELLVSPATRVRRYGELAVHDRLYWDWACHRRLRPSDFAPLTSIAPPDQRARLRAMGLGGSGLSRSFVHDRRCRVHGYTAREHGRHGDHPGPRAAIP